MSTHGLAAIPSPRAAPREPGQHPRSLKLSFRSARFSRPPSRHASAPRVSSASVPARRSISTVSLSRIAGNAAFSCACCSSWRARRASSTESVEFETTPVEHKARGGALSRRVPSPVRSSSSTLSAIRSYRSLARSGCLRPRTLPPRRPSSANSSLPGGPTGGLLDSPAGSTCERSLKGGSLRRDTNRCRGSTGLAILEACCFVGAAGGVAGAVGMSAGAR